jgi:hypothetical protein
MHPLTTRQNEAILSTVANPDDDGGRRFNAPFEIAKEAMSLARRPQHS